MADSDFSLFSYLKTQYPSVPITTVLKVINKYENDQEKCRQALDSEFGQRFNAADRESLPTISVSKSSNSSSYLDSPGEGKSIAARIKELRVSHEGSPQNANSERHVSTVERSIGNVSRHPEQVKRPFVGHSMSYAVQDRLSPADAQTHSGRTSSTPQTTPPDFSSFFSRSATDIPNINCSTHGATGLGSGSVSHESRPQKIPVNSLSASSSPVEQRRPVKVINIFGGSSSGGSVSPAGAQSNARHIHMNFGDSGGICTVSTPPTLQRYGSASNISQNFISEISTEAPTHHPVHSSSIVVNTGHANHVAPERKLNTSISDYSVSGRRTPNPPHSLNMNDFQSNSGTSNVYSSGRLSTPVQATSPGIAHSKPVFVEVKTDRLSGSQLHGGYNGTTYPPGSYPGGNVSPAPLNPRFLSHQSMVFNAQSNPQTYNTQYRPDFSNAAGFPISQPQNEFLYQNSQQHRRPGFHSPPTNLHLHPTSAGFIPNSYSDLNLPTSLVGYSLIPGHFPGQTPSHLTLYTHYSPNAGNSVGTHMPKSPTVVGQQSLGSRSSSQDSEHSVGMDHDARHPPYNAMGSHVSSLSSLSSDSSSSHVEAVDPGKRSRSGSMQDEAEYVRALVQNQKRQLQKLLEEINRHRGILNKLRSEVGIMEKNMIETSHVNRSFPSVEDISWMCESNRVLQTDIQLYMNDIDMYKSGQTPFNKINPLDQQNFYANMPTGQQDPVYSRTPHGRRLSPSRPFPPRRPPPPIPARKRSAETGQASAGAMPGSDIFRVPPVPQAQPMINSGDSEESESWNCTACTFSNHPALKKCEMCEMPRVTPPDLTTSLDPQPPASHQSLSSLPPRLAPGPSLVGNMHPRSVSPHSALGRHEHHRAGT